MLLNSVLVTLATATGVVLLAVVWLRLSFHASGSADVNPPFNFMTLGLLFPIAVAILPLYITLRQSGLVDTLWGIILPQVAFALPINILILRGFFSQVPVELEEAAALDGCSTIGFFWRILLPLVRPALAAVVVLTMVLMEKRSFSPLLVVINTEALYTIPPRYYAVPGTIRHGLARRHGLHLTLAHSDDCFLSGRGTANCGGADGGGSKRIKKWETVHLFDEEILI